MQISGRKLRQPRTPCLFISACLLYALPERRRFELELKTDRDPNNVARAVNKRTLLRHRCNLRLLGFTRKYSWAPLFMVNVCRQHDFITEKSNPINLTRPYKSSLNIIYIRIKYIACPITNRCHETIYVRVYTFTIFETDCV